MAFTQMEKAGLFERANAVGRESRRQGAPYLELGSSVETIASWLHWCDPNGCHTAENAAAEGFDPYDDETVLDALAEMLANA